MFHEIKIPSFERNMHLEYIMRYWIIDHKMLIKMHGIGTTIHSELRPLKFSITIAHHRPKLSFNLSLWQQCLVPLATAFANGKANEIQFPFTRFLLHIENIFSWV